MIETCKYNKSQINYHKSLKKLNFCVFSIPEQCTILR